MKRWPSMLTLFSAILILYAIGARADEAPPTPGIRETWIAPPPLKEFERVAGRYGFVIVRDPVREDIVLTKLEACRLQADTLKAAESALTKADAALLAKDEQIARLTIKVDELHAQNLRLVGENAALTVKASRPKGRWVSGAIGFAGGVLAAGAIP